MKGTQKISILQELDNEIWPSRSSQNFGQHRRHVHNSKAGQLLISTVCSETKKTFLYRLEENVCISDAHPFRWF